MAARSVLPVYMLRSQNNNRALYYRSFRMIP
jgi:hypothetical protein